MEVSLETLLSADRSELVDLLQVFIKRNGLGQTVAFVAAISEPSVPLAELNNELQAYIVEQMGGAGSGLLNALQTGSSAEHLRATIHALEFLARGAN